MNHQSSLLGMIYHPFPSFNRVIRHISPIISQTIADYPSTSMSHHQPTAVATNFAIHFAINHPSLRHYLPQFCHSTRSNHQWILVLPSLLQPRRTQRRSFTLLWPSSALALVGRRSWCARAPKSSSNAMLKDTVPRGAQQTPNDGSCGHFSK